MELRSKVPEHVSGIGAVIARVGETSVARVLFERPDAPVGALVERCVQTPDYGYYLLETIGTEAIAAALEIGSNATDEDCLVGLGEAMRRTRARQLGLDVATATWRDIRFAADDLDRAVAAEALGLDATVSWDDINRRRLGLPPDATEAELSAVRRQVEAQRNVVVRRIKGIDPVWAPEHRGENLGTWDRITQFPLPPQTGSPGA